ncbi:MAG: hypothetical protein WDO73_33920 [Ignavibacteriota bacterium]
MRPATLLLLPFALLAQQPPPIVFQHANIIDGTGRVLHEASLEIAGSRIEGINLPLKRGAGMVDCRGKYIIPGLINAHGHLGITRGAGSGPENYTPENVAAQLDQYVRYGVTTVLSLGLNRDLVYVMRGQPQNGATIFTAGRGIGVPGGAPPLNVADDQCIAPRLPMRRAPRFARWPATIPTSSRFGWTISAAQCRRCRRRFIAR